MNLRSRSLRPIAGAAALGILAIGCSGTDTTSAVDLEPTPSATAAEDGAPSDASDTTSDTTSDDASDPSADATRATPDDDLLDPTDAGELAVAEIGPGEVVRVVRDDDDGQPRYEVLVRTEADAPRGYEVTVDARDGAILDVDRDDLDDTATPPEATVTRAEAEQLALDAAGATEVRKTELNEDDGRYEWEVDVRREDGRHVEVTLDASDGSVLEVDVDD